MKCPYITNQVQLQIAGEPKVRSVTVTGMDDCQERLHLTVNDITYTTVEYPTECLKEECGAYQNERCVRRA
jgi:hypothetical protein